MSGDLVRGEMIIAVHPGGDTWIGTAAQLQEAGVLPAGFEWPSVASGRDCCRACTVDGIYFHLVRERPEGTRGRHYDWRSIDWWRLERRPADRRARG